MAPDSWESFGGRLDGQERCVPLESDLLLWAEGRGFVPVQAQALLCDDKVYTPSYRKRLLIPHEFEPGAVQGYNKTAADKVTPLKVFLNPMHLLVQQAYFKDKVSTCHCCSNGSTTWLQCCKDYMACWDGDFAAENCI